MRGKRTGSSDSMGIVVTKVRSYCRLVNYGGFIVSGEKAAF